MRLTRRPAAVLALLDGLLAVYVGYTLPTPSPVYFLLVFGALLVIDSAFCFFGVRHAFAVSGLLSLLLAGYAPFAHSSLSDEQLYVLGISLISFVASLMAYRTSSGLPEQVNPMNLPVFG